MIFTDKSLEPSVAACTSRIRSQLFAFKRSQMRSYLPGEIRTLETHTNINLAQGNIMIDENEMPLIGDFGTSYAIFRSLNRKAMNDFPIIEHIAPELKSLLSLDNSPTKAGDIYSFGMTIKKVCSPHTRRDLCRHCYIVFRFMSCIQCLGMTPWSCRSIHQGA